MNGTTPRLSLVVPTVSRAAELTQLLESLLRQEFKDFEIIVVDQNCDERIAPVLASYRPKLDLAHVRTPTKRGVSSGRNDGWRRARGDVILFPDDDCWYPPWFLRKGLEILASTGAELVTGRSADATGRGINGRFESHAHFITRRSIWSAQVEWATFFRRELLQSLGGFDENIGIGGPSYWQAAEGPDLILAALARGRPCYYDPTLYGFHREYNIDDPASGMVRKARDYGRGMGYVMRRHRFGVISLLPRIGRPLAGVFISAITGRYQRIRYFLSVAVGRFEGWIGHVWRSSGTQKS
jgi:glycosyltransferase involved in cell wall biosynthesis